MPSQIKLNCSGCGIPRPIESMLIIKRPKLPTVRYCRMCIPSNLPKLINSLS